MDNVNHLPYQRSIEPNIPFDIIKEEKFVISWAGKCVNFRFLHADFF